MPVDPSDIHSIIEIEAYLYRQIPCFGSLRMEWIAKPMLPFSSAEKAELASVV